MKISIEQVDPPIGLLGTEYRATVEGSQEGPIGYGGSEEEALRDLLDNFDDTWGAS